MDKKQILLILGIAILLVGIPVAIVLVTKPMGFRLGAKSPNAAENVTATNLSAYSATISWSTANPALGGVDYGLSATSMTFYKPETESITTHTVTLDNLVAGTKYYYVVKVGDNTYNNNGDPFVFTTKSKEENPTPTITEKDIIDAMGTNNPTYDLNKDGVVNSLDLELFRQQNTK